VVGIYDSVGGSLIGNPKLKDGGDIVTSTMI
jgi:hypothetical protein